MPRHTITYRVLRWRKTVVLPRLDPEIIREAVLTLARINADLFRYTGCIPIVSSGVKFKNDPDAVDQFTDAITTYAAGGGDCEDLTAWMVAEAWCRGIPADVGVERISRSESHVFPVLIHGDIRIPIDISTILMRRTC